MLREALGCGAGPPLADLDDSVARAGTRTARGAAGLGGRAADRRRPRARPPRRAPARAGGARPRGAAARAAPRPADARALPVGPPGGGARRLPARANAARRRARPRAGRGVAAPREGDPRARSGSGPAASSAAGRASGCPAREGRGRARLAVVAGAILLAGAIAAIVLGVTGGSDAVTVEPNSVAAVDPETGRDRGGRADRRATRPRSPSAKARSGSRTPTSRRSSGSTRRPRT